jgi:hypothetical protein
MTDLSSEFSSETVVIERTVDAPRRLVWQMWTESEHFAAWCGPMGASMSDADGNVVDPASRGMPPGAPVATQIIVELSDLDGKTKMVMTHEGVPANSPGATGWGMALDKLEARVTELLS